MSGPIVAHGIGRPAYSQTMAREPRSVSTARGLARTALAVWGLEALIDDATVVISELASNAVDHARLSSIRVVVSRTSSSSVRLGVVDRSRNIPILKAGPVVDRARGRGLLLVDSLADRWGTERYRWGKQVWAELGQGDPA
ncbi:hypothetical protein GCM10010363_06950 [Streptomyces omiyaensis]|uniref:ATP-binding protein n=1 Tax=Streptomyces omiyaensis TaxID=68247 RepID=UPI0019C124A5|nr:ATP-binding protein [Streptomyces omiyaensis]GGY29220.1 hypothetical protein GCM10010363_06950 [Streptomyces omiyaensis]